MGFLFQSSHMQANACKLTYLFFLIIVTHTVVMVGWLLCNKSGWICNITISINAALSGWLCYNITCK